MPADRLRIAFFVDNFYPQFNGVLTSYMNTINELARRGHEILVVAPKIAPRRRYDPRSFPYPLLYKRGVPAFFYPDFRLTWPFSLASVLRTRRFAADLIHFHSPLTIAMQGIATARLLRLPLVGTFHTFFAEPEYLRVVGLESWRFLIDAGWWYNNLLYEACDVVVSPSEWTASELLARKIRTRIEVVPNGVELSRYTVPDAARPRPASLPPLPAGADLVIYVGRISREKSIDVVIKAMERVFPIKPKAHLAIVGDGPARPELMDYARERGLLGRITFTGMIPNEVLLASGLLGEAKLFATASTSENQPMTILEAMIFGLPIVGVDAKGVPEMIRGNGFLCPPEDPDAMSRCILALLEREELRREMAAASRRLAQEYAIERTTDKLLSVYHGAIEAKRSMERRRRGTGR
ncbi:MAG: glycosyltransferase [Patescibacteria group bacterium]